MIFLEQIYCMGDIVKLYCRYRHTLICWTIASRKIHKKGTTKTHKKGTTESDDNFIHFVYTERPESNFGAYATIVCIHLLCVTPRIP